MQPVSIADGPPEGEETAAAVRKLRPDRAVGPSVMKAEHLESWLRKGTREKYLDTEAWDKVVSVVQVAFQDRYTPEELMWTTVVLILKGDGGYRGIGLVKSIWKVYTSIVNSRLQSSIVLYDILH